LDFDNLAELPGLAANEINSAWHYGQVRAMWAIDA